MCASASSGPGLRRTPHHSSPGRRPGLSLRSEAIGRGKKPSRPIPKSGIAHPRPRVVCCTRYVTGRGSSPVSPPHQIEGMRRTVLLASVALALLLTAGVAWVATIDCVTGEDFCVGTDELDTIHGSEEKDKMCGLDGDGIVLGSGGDDRVYCGNDRNTIEGGSGNDPSMAIPILTWLEAAR